MAVDLSILDDDFEQAEEADSRIPDGKYQAYIDRIAVDINDYTGEPQLTIELVITDGPQEGRRVFYRKQFVSKSLPYIKKDLNVLGICPPRLSQLEEYIPQALDLICDITMRTGKPNAEGKTYQNPYINKVVGKRDSAAINQAMNNAPF